MLSRFLAYFRDPQDENPSFIRLTRNILIFAMVTTLGILLLVAGVVPGVTRNIPALAALGVVTALEVVSFVQVLRGRVLVAKLVVPVALLTAITFIALTGGGMHDLSVSAYPVAILISTLLLGARSRYTTTPLAVLSAELVVVADLLGINTSVYASGTDIGDAFIVAFILLATSGILQLLIGRLNENVKRAQDNEQAQILANAELRELQVTLENRVASRTAQLELANAKNERRARQFEAIAQVARATTNIQNLELLLPRLVELISTQFGFYHAGIFLLDENREFAVLRAANSEGGKRMLARGHRLGVGQSGIVGYVSGMGKPRIALDVGSDAVFFDNPDLPNTRSEMALPLRAADEIIGVLDVQSLIANAFQEEDIEVLSTLADQVAIAIQNARSHETMESLLQEAQRATGSIISDAWRVLQGSEETVVGYQVVDNKLLLLDKPISSASSRKAVTRRQTIHEDGDMPTLAIPIRLRDEVIGVMDIQIPYAHEWDTDEIDIAQAVAQRLSLALESALLLKSTRRRAEIERITADITGRIGATTQFDSILRTAAEELSRALGGSDVLIQIQPETVETAAQRTQTEMEAK